LRPDTGVVFPWAGSRALRPPALPLDAELARLVGVDLGDQALHIDLRAARIELVDHGAQLAVLRFGRGDDE
jgi:hypothetical protein